ncbi:MAG: DUF2272 domain-containing protein [Pseudomonadota bacterium]
MSKQIALSTTGTTVVTQQVNAKSLNLRSEPLVKPSTLIEKLPFGHSVDVVGPSTRTGWVVVATDLNGVSLTGHVSATYLRDPLSAKVEAALDIAAYEWERFERGAGKETQAPYFRYVGEYWAALGLAYDGRDTSKPWSAAFISFLFREAGYTGMTFAAAHARYINEAIVARQAGDTSRDFHGYRLTERVPQIGDLIARRRTSATYIDYDYAATHNAFKSHTDMVVAVGAGYVDAVGGNLSNSVNVVRYRTGPSGYLDSQNGKLFAVLQNRR